MHIHIMDINVIDEKTIEFTACRGNTIIGCFRLAMCDRSITHYSDLIRTLVSAHPRTSDDLCSLIDGEAWLIQGKTPITKRLPSVDPTRRYQSI